jgi:6-phosphogluconolactonase
MKKIARCCVLLAIMLSQVRTSSFGASHGDKYLLFVGTYTDADGKASGSKGIYSYHFDEPSGKLVSLGVAAETTNPSFLAVAPGGKFLYAVNEVRDYENAASGGVTAFAIDRKTGKLAQLNEVASRGSDPCYISFDRSEKFALVANYTGGDVAVLPLLADGRIAEASSVVNDTGILGPKKDRQDAPHAHWIEASAQNRFAYVADLALDRVLIYKFDANKGTLSAGNPPSSGTSKGGDSDKKEFFSAILAPGTGPRHIAFSRDGNFMYVLGELDSTVTMFANDSKETFRPMQKISALPAGFSGKNDAAEIAIHPSGKFLYTSNRGDDSIAVFTIDRTSGKLTFTQRLPSGGKAPRSFTIDPQGAHLLVANQDSGNIVEFGIDHSTGKLTAVGEIAKVPSPVCLVFLALD